MTEKVSYVYLRLSADARLSKISAAAAVIENMLGAVTLESDTRDASVYCFALPSEIDDTQAKRIISALVTEPYIDEAWKKDGTLPAFSPAAQPK